jgi:uncharacterized protein
MDRIDVFTVARNRADWSGRLPLAAMPRLCASLMDGPGDRDGMLAYRCRGLIDAQGRPGLELRLDAILPLRCDRCAQKLALVLEAERRFYFVTTQAELAAIPIDDAPEEALLGSAQFDLAALIEDEAILQLPISPRHADCVGAARAAPHKLPPRPIRPRPPGARIPLPAWRPCASSCRARRHRTAPAEAKCRGQGRARPAPRRPDPGKGVQAG